MTICSKFESDDMFRCGRAMRRSTAGNDEMFRLERAMRILIAGVWNDVQLWQAK